MLFLRQLRLELLKLFARKRTYLGFAAFFCMEIAVLILFNRPGPRAGFRHMIEKNGFGFDEYYSGFTLAMLMVHSTALLLGSLYLSLVAGDLVAKEVEEGTMRMVLCRPVSRLRIMVLKYFAAMIYTFVLVEFIGLTALAAGLAYRHSGGLFVIDPPEHIFALVPPERALRVYMESLPLLAFSMATVSSIGFLCSCCNMKPAAASILTLSVVFLDYIFRNIPYFESLKGYFITTHMAAWMHCFEAYPPWSKMIVDFTYLAGVDITCLILGAAIFMRRDLK